MTREVVTAVLVTLIVGDVARSSRLLAAGLARWAAGRVYVADEERASRRPEEWDALVRESVPSDISAFCLGVSFAVFAVACLAGRRVRAMMSRALDAYARLTRVPPTSLGAVESRWEELRRAILALLASALELRQRFADGTSLTPEQAASQGPDIRRLAAAVQLEAASVSLLEPAGLGGPAERLAATAARLSDQAFPPGGNATPVTGTLDLRALDRSISAFRQRAVAASRDLANRRAAAAEPACSPDAGSFKSLPGALELGGKDIVDDDRAAATHTRGRGVRTGAG